MSCKHRGYFILTTFTLPHLRTYWYTGISASHSFRAVHSEFCQTALLVILTIWQPHPHCHTQLVPLQTFPHLAVLGCASHDFPELITLIVCIRLTLFGVLVNSLQGVTPSFEISVMQFSKTTFIKLFVTLGYAFVGYSHRFRRRTCHTVRKLVKQKADVNRQFAVIFVVRFVAKQIEKLRLQHSDNKIKRAVRIAHYEEKCALSVA